MVGVVVNSGADKLCLHYHHSLSKTAKLWLQEQWGVSNEEMVGPPGLEPGTNGL